MLENIKDVASKAAEKVVMLASSDFEKPSADGLGEKIDQLMPSIWIMIATLGSLCFILIILTKLLYNPIQKMVQRRKDFIQQNIDESVQVKKNAYDLELEARTKLQESKAIGNDLVTKARIEADTIKNQYIEQGKSEAERIIREAKEDIKARKASLEKEAYNEIVSVAMEISEKIIKDKVTEKEAKKYLDEYLGNK